MKTRIKRTILAAVATICTTGLQAQAVIGEGAGDKEPMDYAMLQLESGGKGGLRLPKTDDLVASVAGWYTSIDVSPAAEGLMYYNTVTNQVEYMDGTVKVRRWKGEENDATQQTGPTPPLPHRGGVTIGDDTPAQPFSVLQIETTNKGMRLPTITDEEMETLLPQLKLVGNREAEGLMFYNKVLGIVFFDGKGWVY